MKTKLLSSSNPSAKSVIKSNSIFSLLFILLITFSSFGQSEEISFTCAGAGTISFENPPVENDLFNGYHYWVGGTDGASSKEYLLFVQDPDPDGNGNYRWEVHEAGGATGDFPNNTNIGTLYFSSIDYNVISPPCVSASWIVEYDLLSCYEENEVMEKTGIVTVNCVGGPITEPCQTWYLGVDNDGDTYFGSQLTADCENPGGYSLTPPTIDDCDDTLGSGADINPGATEVCDGIDNNCDGIIDEGVTTTYYVDADGDGFGDMNDAGKEYCDDPGVGFSLNNNDCDDTEFDNEAVACYEYCNDKKTKVIMCHNGKDICVSVNAMDAHLAHGDELGSCISGKISNNVDDIIDESPTTFDVAFWPNPSNNTFNVKMITPNGSEKVSIKAFDINGRLVHSNTINGNQNYKFGNNLSAGIYMVKLTQESTTKMIKLVKQ